MSGFKFIRITDLVAIATALGKAGEGNAWDLGEAARGVANCIAIGGGEKEVGALIANRESFGLQLADRKGLVARLMKAGGLIGAEEELAKTAGVGVQVGAKERTK